MSKNQKLLGSFSILAATGIYGFFSILARIIGYELPIFFQNWTREIVASVILFLIIIATKTPWKKMKLKEFLWVWLRSMMGSIAFLMFFLSVNQMPIGTTYFLFYGGSTIIGYLLGHFLFYERMTTQKWFSIFFAMIGLGTIYSLHFTNVPLYLIAMALGAGGATAFWNVAMKKLNHFSSLQLTFLDNFLPIFFYVALSLITHETWSVPTLSPVWIASLGYGALFVITGQLVIFGFQRVDAQIGSIFMLAEVPIAILLGYLFYQETITTATLIGGLCIGIAILVPELSLILKKKKINPDKMTLERYFVDSYFLAKKKIKESDDTITKSCVTTPVHDGVSR